MRLSTYQKVSPICNEITWDKTCSLCWRIFQQVSHDSYDSSTETLVNVKSESSTSRTLRVTPVWLYNTRYFTASHSTFAKGTCFCTCWWQPFTMISMFRFFQSSRKIKVSHSPSFQLANGSLDHDLAAKISRLFPSLTKLINTAGRSGPLSFPKPYVKANTPPARWGRKAEALQR